MSTHHKQATSRERGQIPAHCRTQAAAHPVPDHRASHGLAHHEPNERRLPGCLREKKELSPLRFPPSAAESELLSAPLLFRAQAAGEPPLVGFVVSKSVGSAVVRN